MNQELAALAKQKGVEPPTSASLTDQAKGAVMSVMPGATFDKQYVSQQLTAHKETLALMEKQASWRRRPGPEGPGHESHPGGPKAHHRARGTAEAARVALAGRR